MRAEVVYVMAQVEEVLFEQLLVAVTGVVGGDGDFQGRRPGG
jgi:hypothetical protein